MERWEVRERVCAVELFIQTGQLQRLSADFAVDGINRKSYLQMQSIDG
jgi:hypothetical protein